MAYAKQRKTVFLDIKLTDHGRHLLSHGKLLFKTATYLDREVNYRVGRDYDISNNVICAPAFDAPTVPQLVNYDGTGPIDLEPYITYRTENPTASTNSGFFKMVEPLGYLAQKGIQNL
jgi:hypothetical protein